VGAGRDGLGDLGESCVMQDARYLCAQAALCLEIADQMSDPKSAEKMRADAARYHERAAQLEAGEEPSYPMKF
jgi:hypothetical protein